MWVPHYKFAGCTAGGRADASAIPRLVSNADLLMIDAYDLDQPQDHPSRSRLRCLDALRIVQALAPADRPRVVAYSTSMSQPVLNVTLQCTGVVAARFRPGPLLDNLTGVLLGRDAGAEPQPAAADWKRIHPDLRPSADLARLHVLMESNSRAWRLVWDEHAPFDQAVQKWISRQILPWLSDSEHPSYRIAIDVTRRCAGFSAPV